MITLSTPEFAYLLATVGAEEVVGLEAPELFPEDEKAQEATYQQGLDELIANEWIQESDEQDGTYNFDPYLFEMAAIIAAPEFVVVTVSRRGKQDNALLNYLVEERIVQLAALEDDQYSIGFVPELQDLTDRAVELIEVTENNADEEMVLSMDLFESMQDSKKSFSKSLEGSLSKADIDADVAAELESAFTGGSQSEVVVASLEAGEIAHGRRAWIYGTGEQAWLFHLTSASAKEITAQRCTPSNLEGWIEESLADLE